MICWNKKTKIQRINFEKPIEENKGCENTNFFLYNSISEHWCWEVLIQKKQLKPERVISINPIKQLFHNQCFPFWPEFLHY